MAGKGPEQEKIALEIVEHSPSVALRVRGPRGGWKIDFITGNISAYGYTREEFLTGELSWADIVHPDDLPGIEDTIDNNIAQGIDSYSLLYRIVSRNGRQVWVQCSSSAYRDPQAGYLYTDCIISDYTQLKDSQDKVSSVLSQQAVLNEILMTLQEAENGNAVQMILDRAGAFLDLSRVVLYKDDVEHRYARPVCEWHNAGIPSLLQAGDYAIDMEYSLPEIQQGFIAQEFQVVQPGEIPENCRETFSREGVLSSAIFPLRLPEGRYGMLCFDECLRERYWEKDTVNFLKSISQLVTTALIRKTNEDAIRQMAYCDALTGLPNRYSFDMYLQEAAKQARESGRMGYVLFIDMDDFKIINDGYGHEVGDALLLEVAEYFRTRFQDGCRLFRFGGDEFVILVPPARADAVQAIISDILGRAQSPWYVMDRTFYCTISIGVVRFPEEVDGDTSNVIKNADIAMYQAKKRGKNNFVVYSPSLDNDSIARAELEHRLRAAIDNNFEDFRVYYQPMVNLEGRIIGAEALVRWFGENGQMILPGQFIPLAEYLGLIVPLGDFVLRAAALTCRQLNQILPDFVMSVNVSMRQFQQPDYLHRTEQILLETGVKTTNIIIEVTEGMAAQDIGNLKQVVNVLRSMGVKTAMDDFGAGYSSLSNMREIPLDIIKIDRSFIRDIATEDYSKSFIHMMCDLSHSMGREVCVEGVETQEQHHYCIRYGADTIQGFYFWKPMPASELIKLVEETGGQPLPRQDAEKPNPADRLNL